jgi:uncharacterized protein (DUF2062 family)
MRRWLRRITPDHDAIRGNRWLVRFESTLLHPRLWHINRRSAAGGVAVGLFCGLIPGPLQIVSASLAAVLFRINLPVALVCTFYTNPFTIVPLYLVAFELGSFALGIDGTFVKPPAYGDAGLAIWLDEIVHWGTELGKPLAVGILLLASLLSALGYGLVRLAWRVYLVRAWHQRRGIS